MTEVIVFITTLVLVYIIRQRLITIDEEPTRKRRLH